MTGCDSENNNNSDVPHKRYRQDSLISVSSTATVCCLVAILSSSTLPGANAWGGSSSSDDVSMYGDTLNRDWLYDGSTLSIKLEGCAFSYVYDSEDFGCMEESSEDGTTYWYQMSNCPRANAVYSVYAGDNGCNSNSFKESFVTKMGVPEFLYYLASYDGNSPFNEDNDDWNDDDGGGGGFNADELPTCEGGDNGYIGMGCSSSGGFQLEYFNDGYCTSPTGTTYDSLNSLNNGLKYYQSCAVVYSNGDENNLLQKIIPYSETCSSLDSKYCQDNSALSARMGGQNSFVKKSKSGWLNHSTSRSWATKLKYGTGSLLLFASFVMFTGILFTNRRRRRALMQRKFRQSSAEKSRKKSRSKSRSRGDQSRKSSRSKRSRSRSKRAAEAEGGGETGGVYT